MIVNQLFGGSTEAVVTPTSMPRIPAGALWLANIICHLRDDLTHEIDSSTLPDDMEIHRWVTDSYYPGLLELTWEEAILSLLMRMRMRTNDGKPHARKTEFAEIAMVQLRRTTQHSQLWCR